MPLNSDTNKLNKSFPQEPLWNETLEIIKCANNAGFLSDPKSIEDKLPFNSKETRKRYSRTISNRFCRLDLSIRQGLIDLAMSNVGINIIEQIWRIFFYITEPLVGQVYLQMVWPREPGTYIKRIDIKCKNILTKMEKMSSKNIYINISFQMVRNFVEDY